MFACIVDVAENAMLGVTISKELLMAARTQKPLLSLTPGRRPPSSIQDEQQQRINMPHHIVSCLA